jgi:4-amino-4-deoxy-L-arabinose transferase-like glycosyltransferase
VLRAGTFAGALVITLLPWMIHINEPGLPFAVITRTSYMNLYIGNHARSAGHGMREYASLAPTRLEAERVAREIALENIAGRMPAWPFEKIASEVPRFFTPTSFAVRRLLMPPGDPGNWGYRFRWRFGDRTSWRIAGVIIVVASYIGIVTTGMAGLLLARRRDLSALFLVFLASQILPSIVAFSMSRFRLPSMVVFIVGAASISVSGRRDWAEAPALSRWLAAGAVALIVCFIGADYESVLQSTGR